MQGFALYFPHSVRNIQNSTKFFPIFLCVYSLRIIFVRLNYYLSHIIDTVESTYQCIFLDKIIKFLKHLVHYHPNIFAYCENEGFVLYFPHSVPNIQDRKCQIFAYFSVLVFTVDNFLAIKLLSIAYY